MRSGTSAAAAPARLDRDFESPDSGEVDPDPRVILDDLRKRVAAVCAAENDAGASVDVSGPDRPGCTTVAQVPTAVVISTANTS
jgi:hypothetical protein